MLINQLHPEVNFTHKACARNTTGIVMLHDFQKYVVIPSKTIITVSLISQAKAVAIFTFLH
jgi:hypothetical protein